MGRRGSGSQSAAKVVAVFLAAFVAVHPPLKLWVPWAAESFVASIIGRPWGWRQHRWQPLAAALVPPTPVNTINATELAAGATVDLTRPLLVRDAATAEALELFSVEALQRPPLGDVVIDYFVDATRSGHLVPDGRARLGDVVRNITLGAPHKIGSQYVVSRHGCCPDRSKRAKTLEALLPRALARAFGGERRFSTTALDLSLLTVPLFVAGTPVGARPRTDLHSEPIASVAVQLRGSKRWTLVDAAASAVVRPRPSPDGPHAGVESTFSDVVAATPRLDAGRAYFRSSLHDSEVDRIAGRYEVETTAGDMLYVPPWTWHAVAYDSTDVSVAASLFHFVPSSFIRNQPAFAVAILPNLAKELVGVKTQ